MVMEKIKFGIGDIERLSWLSQDVLRLNPIERVGMSKLLLPGEIKTPDNREKLITEFLKNWLTEKQRRGMGHWYTEMLDAFMTEVLLTAQKVGVEKLLINGSTNLEYRQRERRSYPLIIVPSSPKKPKVAQVTLEEVGGDLVSDTKSILLSDVKSEQKINSIVDVVDHVK